MTLGDRIEERRRAADIPSQSELARRAKIGQSTLSGLIRKPYRWSPHLTKIARALGTTVEYLIGETDDPNSGVPATPELDSETQEMVDHFTTLSPADRRALLQVARSMSDGPVAHATVQDRRAAYDPGGDEGRSPAKAP